MSILSGLNPLDRIGGSGQLLDVSKLDPTRTKVINGELYRWVPDDAAQQTNAGDGANYDPNVAMLDASNPSGGGSWQKADPYTDPTFNQLMRGVGAGILQTGAYAAGADALTGGFAGTGGGSGAADASGAGATGGGGGAMGAGLSAASDGYTAPALGASTAGALGSAASGAITSKDLLNLGLNGAEGITNSVLQNKQANANTALSQDQLAQQEKQFEASLANQQALQAGVLSQADPLAQQRSRQKNALLSSILSHYSPAKYNAANQTFSGGANDLTSTLQDPALQAMFSQAAAQSAENQFTGNAQTASNGLYQGPNYAGVYGGTTTPLPTALNLSKNRLASTLVP